MQLVPLILQHLAQIVGHLAGDLLHISVQLAQIIGQAHQLVEGADLRLEFIISRVFIKALKGS